MGRFRYLIVIVAAALLVPVGAAAAMPQVYVANGSGYSVAFADEVGKVSVLGLDTRLYCSETGSLQKQKPRAFHRLAAPLPLRPGAGGLTAVVDETEMTAPASLSFTANPGGAGLVGTFGFTSEETPTSHCQTGTYYGGDATVPFEAMPFVRVDSPDASDPSTGETPIYFTRKGPFEIFMRGEGNGLLVRGAVTSGCRFGGAHRSRRSPFFGIPFRLQVEWESYGGYFGKTAGREKGAVVKEVTHLAGYTTETAVVGTYARRETIGTGPGARDCTIGPIHFRAERYVPAKP